MWFEQARNGNDSPQITERMKMEALQRLPSVIKWNEVLFGDAFKDLTAFAKEDTKVAITSSTGDALAGLRKGIFG